MKKLFCGAVAAALIMISAAPVFAAESSISIKNNISSSKPVSYTYDENTGESVKSIKKLMTKLDNLTGRNSVVQTLTITSENADGNEVELKLRLSIPETDTTDVLPASNATPSPNDYKALDYYNLVITDAQGDVLYDYEQAEETEQSTYKDIPLGLMNVDTDKENKIFNLTISVNKDLNTDKIKEKAEKLDWSIVSEAINRVTVTESPAAEIKTEAIPDSATAAPAITVSPTPSSKGTVKSDKYGVTQLSAGEYTVGTDVDKGKYTMTGSGKVYVYDSNGTHKVTVALKSKEDNSAAGVSEYNILLSDGERLVVDSDILLTPDAVATPTVTPSATPSSKASSASGTSSSGTTSKTNPKTGDNAPIVIVSVIGVLAAAGVVFIAIKKRKTN